MEYVKKYFLEDYVKNFVDAMNNLMDKSSEVPKMGLVYGAPGLGKTTLSYIIANEMGVNVKVTSGPVIDKPGDLAGLLTNLEPNDVLFLTYRISFMCGEIINNPS